MVAIDQNILCRIRYDKVIRCRQGQVNSSSNLDFSVNAIVEFQDLVVLKNSMLRLKPIITLAGTPSEKLRVEMFRIIKVS